MTVRRLDLYPDRKLRGRARHERAFFAAMQALDGWVPQGTGPYENIKVPVYAKAVSVRYGDPTFRRAVVARLLDLASWLAERTPSRVAAIIDWPDLWMSELCVFHDAAYAEGWDPACRAAQPRPARTDWDGGWVEARSPARDLLADLNLTLPKGFTAHGTELAEYDADTARLRLREEWVVMTDPPADRSLP